jgi:erythronate-4-phosphate dehydrogenase
MKIIADQDIPFVNHYFGHCGEIITKPGRTLTRNDLLDAEILIARSVTPINKELLEGTPIRFVGSTVTGIDHIDTPWLESQGIQWAAATGCNAQAVAEYVICVIAALQKIQLLPEKSLRVGVVGIGNIGSRVVELLKLLRFEVIQCDPVRAANEKGFASTDLKKFSDLDFITLHTPLTKDGPYPTFHMIEKNFLQRQKPGCVLLNTGRGSVIDFADLEKFGGHCHWCLDVWEHEPNIDKYILDSALLATPHIAGHSIQSKYRGIEMIYHKAVDKRIIPKGNIEPLVYPKKEIFCSDAENWQDVILQVFDLLQYTRYMKTTTKTFDKLRNEFKDRHEFEFIILHDVPGNIDKNFMKKLNFC